MRCCMFVWVKRQKPISLIPITADGPVAEPTIRGDRKKVPFHCFYPYCISIRRIGNSTTSSQLCVKKDCGLKSFWIKKQRLSVCLILISVDGRSCGKTR